MSEKSLFRLEKKQKTEEKKDTNLFQFPISDILYTDHSTIWCSMVDEATHSLFLFRFFPTLTISHPAISCTSSNSWNKIAAVQNKCLCGENISWSASIDLTRQIIPLMCQNPYRNAWRCVWEKWHPVLHCCNTRMYYQKLGAKCVQSI